jgi:glycine/D-amino acid oxidase-like deaminating enzyme
MLGMTEGPVTGRIVADLCMGREPSFDLTPISPDRF